MLISTASPEYLKLYRRYHPKRAPIAKGRRLRYTTDESLAHAMLDMRKKLGVNVLPAWAMQALLKQLDDIGSSPS